MTQPKAIINGRLNKTQMSHFAVNVFLPLGVHLLTCWLLLLQSNPALHAQHTTYVSRTLILTTLSSVSHSLFISSFSCLYTLFLGSAVLLHLCAFEEKSIFLKIHLID
jgi:hypothetical protein